MRPAALALLCLLFTSSPLAAMDLTLHREYPAADDQSVSFTYLLNGASKVFLRLPPAWSDSSNEQAITLTPDRPQAAVRIEQVPTARPIAFDEAGRVELRRQAQASLPPGVTNVAGVSETADVLPLAGWTSLEIVHAYDLSGTSFRHAVTLLNLPGNHALKITVLARKQDFAEIRERARKALASWFEPAKDLPPAMARDFGRNPGGA